MDMSNRRLEEILEALEREVSGLKTSVCIMEEKLRVHLLADQQKQEAGDVERITAMLEELKKNLVEVSAEVGDLQTEASLEYQHVRAHDVVLQQLVDASPAHGHIDLFFEIENYNPERHARETHIDQWYENGGDTAEDGADKADTPGNQSTTVTSDPVDE